MCRDLSPLDPLCSKLLFQGVILNLKFINRLSSMFDQLSCKWVIYFFFFFFFQLRTEIRARSPLETSIYILREFFFIFLFFLPFFCNKQFTNYSKWLIRYSIYLSRYNTRRCIGNTNPQFIPPIAGAYFSLDCYPTPSELKRILCLLQIAK